LLWKLELLQHFILFPTSFWCSVKIFWGASAEKEKNKWSQDSDNSWCNVFLAFKGKQCKTDENYLQCNFGIALDCARIMILLRKLSRKDFQIFKKKNNNMLKSVIFYSFDATWWHGAKRLKMFYIRATFKNKCRKLLFVFLKRGIDPFVFLSPSLLHPLFDSLLFALVFRPILCPLSFVWLLELHAGGT
jgi:hypothetical protein